MPKDRWLPWFFFLLKLVSDAVSVTLSFFLAYFIKFGMFLPFSVYYKLVFLGAFIWLIVFNLGGLYKSPHKEGKREDNILITSFAITSAAFITLLVIFFLYKEATYAMDTIFYAWCISLVLVNISRSVIWSFYKQASK